MGVIKDGLSALREVLFVCVFLLLLFQPERFNQSLDRAGFTKGSVLGFEWEKKIQTSAEQTKGAGQSISQVQGNLEDLNASLRDIGKLVADQKVQAKITALADDVVKSLKETQVADEAVKTSLLAQQQVMSSPVEPLAGWMYLGKATGDRSGWLPGAPETIKPIPVAQLRPGAVLQVRESVYLRAGTASEPSPEGAVLSVLQRDAQVEVIEMAYPVRKWGTAVWARVKKRV
jgi:hypothetical protein